jgi:transcriptional regulator NrdR family protein
MGLICKKCNVELRSIGTKTVNNEYIIRRRRCPKCGDSFKTIEIHEEMYNDTIGMMTSFSRFIRKSIEPGILETSDEK